MRLVLVLVLALVVVSPRSAAAGEIAGRAADPIEQAGSEVPFPSTLTPESAAAAYSAHMRQTWGAAWDTADTRTVACPSEQLREPHFDDEVGLFYGARAYCEARFSIGALFRASHGTVAEDDVGVYAEGGDWQGAWTRKWTRGNRSCEKSLDTGGRMWTNRYCESLIADDIAYDLRRNRRVRPTYYSHGTNNAGFPEYEWACRVTGAVVGCKNGLGDAFRYRPGSALRQRLYRR